MNPSEIYRKAAELIARGTQQHSCVAISIVVNYESFHERQSYGALFRPSRRVGSNDPWGEWWSEESKVCRDCRVIALCFMAAIAEDEESAK